MHLLILLTISQLTSAITRPIDRDAVTLYYKNKHPNVHGEYNFEFQTSNGITTKGAGNAYGSVGVVQYISLEGIPITWTYTADSDGYQPKGDHIPKTPDYILKSLEYIRTHPMVDEKKSRKLR